MAQHHEHPGDPHEHQRAGADRQPGRVHQHGGGVAPDLSEALMHASRALRRRWWSALEDWDLSPHQARALRTVCGHAGARLSEVAAGLRIAPRSATEVVDSLEARGLVARRPDPADRRAVLVEATEAGREVQAAAEEVRAAAAAAFFGRLTPAERDQLTALLGRLLD